MSVSDIQNFLNTQTPNCDTNGTQKNSINSSLTDAQYAASQGWNAPPYVCLKNYMQVPQSSSIVDNFSGSTPAGAISSAQIIKNAADTYSISPKVLITTLQKESLNLIFDSWPVQNQYKNAMGYGCPDTAPCDPQYAGFYNQVNNAARQFNLYKNYPSNYRYKAYQSNTINYNPSSSCSSSSVFIQDYATAGLYNYTPYQPNQAALNNLYGTGDSCSAYGNRNFWRTYNDWFGATSNSSSRFSVIQGPNSPALYLQTSAGKYYLPSGDVMKAWGLDTLPVQQVSQSYLDSLTTGPWVSNLLKDDWNNYFVVENDTIHYVRDTSYLSLWNISTSNAVQSLGLTSALKSGSWLGRFAQDASQPSGSYWLIDNGQKHLISNNDMLYQWRYTPDQLTTVSSSFLASIPTNNGDVTPYASNGTTNYVVDSGTKLNFNNPDIANAYYGSQSPTIYSPITLSFLPQITASQFTVNSSTGQWFMLEGGKKHYIQYANLAQMWGMAANSSPTAISNSLLTNLPSGGNLSSIVQTSNPSAYWIVDGTKHYIPDSATASAWIQSGTSPQAYSTASLNLVPSGPNATTTINVSGSSYFYTMDNGTKHYLMTNNAKSAWGGSVMTTSAFFMDSVPEGQFLNYTVKDNEGNAYLLMNNVRYSINPSYYSEWGISSSTPIVEDGTIARYSLSPTELKAFISIGQNSYVMSNGNKVAINSSYDAYQPTSLSPASLPSDYFSPAPQQATYLAQASNSQDNSVWLISGGKKYLFSNFASYVSYGYLSRGQTITPLTTESLSDIPTGSTTPGLFIRTASSYGIKFINFGTSLGFPDGDTLSNILGSSPVLIVSDSVYNSFPLVGSVSRILKDDSGKIYLTENGTKRWITNSKAYDPYRSYPVTYLYGTTMSLIPDGPAIN